MGLVLYLQLLAVGWFVALTIMGFIAEAIVRYQNRKSPEHFWENSELTHTYSREREKAS